MMMLLMKLLYSAVTCPPLNTKHANLSSTSNHYLAAVNVTCHLGYRIEAEDAWRVISCQGNGSWSLDESLLCRGKYYCL